MRAGFSGDSGDTRVTRKHEPEPAAHASRLSGGKRCLRGKARDSRVIGCQFGAMLLEQRLDGPRAIMPVPHIDAHVPVGRPRGASDTGLALTHNSGHRLPAGESLAGQGYRVQRGLPSVRAVSAQADEPDVLPGSKTHAVAHVAIKCMVACHRAGDKRLGRDQSWDGESAEKRDLLQLGQDP